MFRLRRFEAKDRDALTALVMTLKKFYPTIDSWWFGDPGRVQNPGQLKKIETGAVDCLLAVVDDEIAGVSIFGEESHSAIKTIKLKTFLIAEKFRSHGMGPFLFDETMHAILSKKPEKVFVTFNEAEVEELSYFFTKYGFQLEAAVFGEYLPGKVEFHLSKFQHYGVLNEEDFVEFVKRQCLQSRGFVIKKKIDDNALEVENLADVSSTERVAVRFVLDQTPIFDVNSKTVYFSFYSPEQKPPGVIVVDGHDLENLFYPMVFNRKVDAGFIAPVKPWFASLLFPDPAQASLEPLKSSLRSDKIFFKSPQVQRSIKRGATFIFYETAPIQKIVGEARVSGVEIGNAQVLYEKYKRKGVVTQENLDAWDCPKTGEIQAILLSRWLKYEKPLDEPHIRMVIPSFNPQGTSSLVQDQLQKIRVAAGYYG